MAYTSSVTNNEITKQRAYHSRIQYFRIGNFTYYGLYNASKFAIEGLSETLASEVKSFGINVTLIEPNGYASDIWKGEFNSASIAAYDGVKKVFSQSAPPDSFGKKEAPADAILKLIETENPPLRLLLGKVALPLVKQIYQERLAVWEEWGAVSEKAHGH